MLEAHVKRRARHRDRHLRRARAADGNRRRRSPGAHVARRRADHSSATSIRCGTSRMARRCCASGQGLRCRAHGGAADAGGDATSNSAMRAPAISSWTSTARSTFRDALPHSAVGVYGRADHRSIASSIDEPLEPFSFTRMWRRLGDEGRLYGAPLGGYWMHVGDPRARDRREARLAAGGAELMTPQLLRLVRRPGAASARRARLCAVSRTAGGRDGRRACARTAIRSRSPMRWCCCRTGARRAG